MGFLTTPIKMFQKERSGAKILLPPQNSTEILLKTLLYERTLP